VGQRSPDGWGAFAVAAQEQGGPGHRLRPDSERSTQRPARHELGGLGRQKHNETVPRSACPRPGDLDETPVDEVPT
jgi:hypothetical protein